MTTVIRISVTPSVSPSSENLNYQTFQKNTKKRLSYVSHHPEKKLEKQALVLIIPVAICCVRFDVIAVLSSYFGVTLSGQRVWSKHGLGYLLHLGGAAG